MEDDAIIVRGAEVDGDRFVDEREGNVPAGGAVEAPEDAEDKVPSICTPPRGTGGLIVEVDGADVGGNDDVGAGGAEAAEVAVRDVVEDDGAEAAEFKDPGVRDDVDAGGAEAAEVVATPGTQGVVDHGDESAAGGGAAARRRRMRGGELP